MPKNRFELQVSFVIDLDTMKDWTGAEFANVLDELEVPWYLLKEAEYANGKRLAEFGYKRPAWVTE